MESNQELFRQAILDAKAVRETAKAVAKASLAEHFEPMIKDMFRETVEGIEESEDDIKKTQHIKHIHEDDMEEGKKADMEESTLDEILAELDALSEEDSADIEEGKVTTTAGYDEKAHTEKGDENGSYTEKAHATKGNTNGSYSEKAKSSIHEADDKEDEEDDKDAEKDDKAEEAGKDLTHDIEGAEDAMGGEEAADEQEVVDITVGELKDIIRDVFMTLQGGDMGPALDADTDLAADLGTDVPGGEEDVDGEISLDEILAELEKEEEGKVEEGAAAGEIPGGQIDPKAADTYKVEADLKEAVKTIDRKSTRLNSSHT